MMKYTKVYNHLKRSNCGKRCVAFKNILENEGPFCYIPTGNACFRKRLENMFENKDFSSEYEDIIFSFDTRKNIMTLAKFQPFCMEHGLDIGLYNLNSERKLPRTVKQKTVCLYLYKNFFCVLWKLNRRTS